jgi:hypothetical protein
VVDAAHRSALTLPERAFWRLFDRTPAQAEALPRHLEVLFREIAGTDEYLASAPFLGGCAKVTRVVRSPRLPFPVVVASPLFVRHERP